MKCHLKQEFGNFIHASKPFSFTHWGLKHFVFVSKEEEGLFVVEIVIEGLCNLRLIVCVLKLFTKWLNFVHLPSVWWEKNFLRKLQSNRPLVLWQNDFYSSKTIETPNTAPLLATFSAPEWVKGCWKIRSEERWKRDVSVDFCRRRCQFRLNHPAKTMNIKFIRYLTWSNFVCRYCILFRKKSENWRILFPRPLNANCIYPRSSVCGFSTPVIKQYLSGKSGNSVVTKPSDSTFTAFVQMYKHSKAAT